MTLLKAKVTPKSEFKLYNCNKIFKCTNLNSKLLFLSLLIYCLYYYLYKNKNTTHDMCHHGFMYEVRDKNTNSQTNDSIKYISNTHRDVM